MYIWLQQCQRSAWVHAHVCFIDTHIHPRTYTPLSELNNHFINSLHWFQFKTRKGEHHFAGKGEMLKYISSYQWYNGAAKIQMKSPFYHLFSPFSLSCRTFEFRIRNCVFCQTIFLYLKFFSSPSFCSSFSDEWKRNFFLKNWWIVFS